MAYRSIDFEHCLRRYQGAPCHRCEMICPNKAIHDGQIDEPLCDDCGLCTAVCPMGAVRAQVDYEALFVRIEQMEEPLLVRPPLSRGSHAPHPLGFGVAQAASYRQFPLRFLQTCRGEMADTGDGRLQRSTCAMWEISNSMRTDGAARNGDSRQPPRLLSCVVSGGGARNRSDCQERVRRYVYLPAAEFTGAASD